MDEYVVETRANGETKAEVADLKMDLDVLEKKLTHLEN